jgi:hypothetical protein
VFEIMDAAAEHSIEVNFLVTEGESLVSRARNNLVTTFLGSNYDVLAFIDADVELRGIDFVRLARMDGVRGAAVCMKGPPGEELLSAWVGGDRLRRADMGAESVSVDFLGAAVLFVPRSAFAALIDTDAVEGYEDAGIGPGHDFFPVGPVNGVFLSEDYYFCKLLNDIGIKITCHPSIIVKHYGSAYWEA